MIDDTPANDHGPPARAVAGDVVKAVGVVRPALDPANPTTYA
ncbi:MAG: hypothetical protein ACE366_20325 [Bradymonadia bacterium]